MILFSNSLEASFGVTSVGYRRQPPYFFCALVVLATLVVGLVQFVLLVFDDVLPFRLVSVVLLVLPHEFVVTLFLLHSLLGQQFYQFFLLLLLLPGYALD